MYSTSQKDDFRRLSKDINSDLEASPDKKQKPSREDDKKKKIVPVNIEKLEPIPFNGLNFELNPTKPDTAEGKRRKAKKVSQNPPNN